jgi:hypothetical protein
MIVDPEAAREARERELDQARAYAETTATADAPPEQTSTTRELPHAGGIPWRPRDLTKDRGW